jgi:hypothetical protein
MPFPDAGMYYRRLPPKWYSSTRKILVWVCNVLLRLDGRQSGFQQKCRAILQIARRKCLVAAIYCRLVLALTLSALCRIASADL